MVDHSTPTYRVARGEAAVVAVAEQVGHDEVAVLDAICLDAPGWLSQIAAVEILRQIWLPRYYRYYVDDEHEIR